MNKIPRKINLDDWDKFGGGYTADSFYHKTDDSLMMKLYAPFMDPEEGLHELEVSEALAQIDIPIPKPIEYVTTGTQYGAVFERLKGKRSIARILADEPNRLDEMAHIFAIEGKKLHSTKCELSIFKPQDELVLERINNSYVIDETVKAKARKLVENTPKCDTCLHGDFHMGNMLIVNDKPLFIDLADFSYGHPYYDLGMFYFNTISNKDTCERLFHCSQDTIREFWHRFVCYYYNESANIDDIIAPYAWLTAVLYCTKIGHVTDALKAVVDKYNDLI